MREIENKCKGYTKLRMVVISGEVLEGEGKKMEKSTQLALKEVGSVQFTCSVMSDSLRPHGLHHARLPCPSPTPRVYSNSRPSSR